MKKIFILFFSLIVFFNFQLDSSAQDTNAEIIAKVNETNILKQNFDRLLNTQKKKFHLDLNFNLLSLPIEDPKITTKRKKLLEKTKEEGISARAKDFDNVWKELTNRYGSIENLQNIAGQKNITIADIRKKIEENILLDKLFEKQTKEKLIEKFVDEELLLQEAEIRNITISEGEVIKRLAQIKQKQGGEETFNSFLSENNATIEDAINELKNQILVKSVKDQINDLNNFLTSKKLNSEIVVYRNRIFPKEENTIPDIVINQNNTVVPGFVRTNFKPTPTVKDIKKLERETNNLLAEELQKDGNVIEPETPKASDEKSEKKIFISNIKEDTVIEPISATTRPPAKTQKKRFKQKPKD